MKKMFDETEVYKNIGLLSIEFAKAEENLKTILVTFISQNKTDGINQTFSLDVPSGIYLLRIEGDLVSWNCKLVKE